MQEPLKIAISACLLGIPVRYDGGHKLQGLLTETLGRFIQWHPVCPEVECGLPVPREPMRLITPKSNPSLVTILDNINYTKNMMPWMENKIGQLEEQMICGFILKSRSPSCGIGDAKIYNKSGTLITLGDGIFTGTLNKKIPCLPIENEERLHNIDCRENFLVRVFVYRRWTNLLQKGINRSGIMDFHREHKLLLLAHSPEHYRYLGRLISGQKQLALKDLSERYINLLMGGLKRIATVNRHVNVLQHIMGYFKKDLSPKDKVRLVRVIEEYQQSRLPLIVPVTLLSYFADKYECAYLKGQVYLNPGYTELMLLNHG